jgi:hypothetical protein
MLVKQVTMSFFFFFSSSSSSLFIFTWNDPKIVVCYPYYMYKTFSGMIQLAVPHNEKIAHYKL